MVKNGFIWRKPINWMILTDEGVRFSGSVAMAGLLHMSSVKNVGSVPKMEDIDNLSQSFCFFVHVGVMGSMWNTIGGTGEAKTNVIFPMPVFTPCKKDRKNDFEGTQKYVKFMNFKPNKCMIFSPHFLRFRYKD